MRSRAFLLAVAGFLTAAVSATSPAPGHDDKSPPRRQRDLTTVQTALGGINAALAKLDEALVHNDIGLSLLPLTMDVLDAIQDARTQIQTSAPLTSVEYASDLKATTDSLTANVNLTVSDLIRNQLGLENLGAAGQVAFGLHRLKLNAVRLARTIAGQIPAELSYVAARAIQDLESVIDRGITAFGNRESSGSDVSTGGAGASAPSESTPLSSPSLTPPPTGTMNSTESLPSSNPSVLPPNTLITLPESPPVPQPTAVSPALLQQSLEPPSGSFGGVFAPMTVPGTFVPGQSCFCACPAIAQCGDVFLLTGP